MQASKLKAQVKAGDLIRAVTSDDSLIKVGSLGHIDGFKNGKDYDMPNHVDVTFNPQIPWIYHDINQASISGGPALVVFPRVIRPTKETRETQHHVKGEPKSPEERLDNSPGWRTIKVKVRVWEVDLIENRKLWKEYFAKHPS